MQSASLLFIVADCGLKLEWIPMEKRFEFWNSVKPHIADPKNRFAERASRMRPRTLHRNGKDVQVNA